MRRLIPAVALVLAAGVAVAQDPPRPSDTSAQPGQSMGKKEMTAIVVSADPTVKTITVRKEGASVGAAQETLSVAGAAVSRLSTIKAGDKVKLTLTTDPTTSKQSVTSIEKDSGSDKP
jgi:hypothetical protein